MSPGYATYIIEPNLGGLEWMQGKVPTPGGDIEIHVSKEQLKIKGAAGVGTAKIKSKTSPTGKNLSVRMVSSEVYEIKIQPGVGYVINYKSSF